MRIDYKLKSSDDINTAIVCRKGDIHAFGIKKENGCVEIAQDGETLFFLCAGVGDEIEEIRITDI